MYRIFDKEKKSFCNIFHYINNLSQVRIWNGTKGLNCPNQDNYIVQQCTGKYSADEDLIYEGDIVGIQMKDPNKMYKAIVKYGDCQFYFEPINENEWIEDWNLIDDSCRFEIIGNIMEDNNVND